MFISIVRLARQRIQSTIKKMSLNDAKDFIIWVDLEMTGLDVKNDHILEMACVVTDANLNTVAETGLTEAVRKSKISLFAAEEQMLSLVKKYTPAQTCPLAGNSVHADKMFLQKYMPKFTNHLHYRIVDVSTIKELCKRWYPNRHYVKKNSHRALDDIHESIEELKFYKKTVFVP